jgi:K+ transporter
MEAFNPYYDGRWFTIRSSHAGFRRLGGILLGFTGVEAMFADIGFL